MDIVKRSKEVFSTEIEELAKVSSRIGEEIARLVELILNCKGKVILTGIGKTGIIARKVSATLSSTGTHSVFMNAAEAMHGDLGIVSRGDIIIAISNSGSSSELLNIIRPLKDIGCPIVAMTGDIKSELAHAADIVLDCGVEREAEEEGIVPTCSTTAALVMGDAIAMCLMELRNFKPENFALYHPGGALGRRLLTRVKDRMTPNVPKVKETTCFKDLIYEVSNRRLGMTLVYNDQDIATGIITDGDIRRAVQKHDDLKSLSAKDIMTVGFKRILPTAQVTEALRIMDENKITSLAVAEDETPTARIIGILHIHNILEFKH